MTPFAVPTAFDRPDLDARLTRARIPIGQPDDERWGAGMPPALLRSLVDRWRNGYDWPGAVRALNRYPHLLADAGGAVLHAVHASNPGRPAVVLLHGWPSTFAQMLPLADALAPDFEVVVPSLPGFAYSPPLAEPFGEVPVARAVHALMTDVLGHGRYLTYGEDVGTWISDRLASTYPGHVAGIAVTHAAFAPPEVRESIGPEVPAFFSALNEKWARERGYSQIQGTKPDTLAASVGDSPSGLLAWIGEKFHAWRDAGRPFEDVWPPDDVITAAMLFWTTESIGTSFRPYFDDPDQPPQPEITVPAAIGIQTGEHDFPRSMIDHTYKDVRVFRRLERGGHFTAWESPDEVAALIRTLAPRA